MKIGPKLIIGFMAIASLVGFVGIFSAVSHNNIQTNSEIITKVLELDILLDESLVKLLAMIQTGNTEDYVREKTDYEETRAEFDALLKQLNNEYAKKLPDLGFNVKTFRKDAGELAKISNRLIYLHKQCLAKDKVSEEKKSLEKELQPRIKNALAALRDEALTRDVELMQYKSKEAIYQYKDQEHGVEWLETISKVKNNPLIVPLQDVSKDLNAYGRVAQDLCKIIIEQNTLEIQEHLVFGELKELITRLEENQAGIVGKIKTESLTLARNTHLTMVAVIAGAFLVSIILGLIIARSISKPVANLAQTTQSIAQGDFSVRVDVATADEIGQLAASFNKMTEDLQETTTSIGNLNREIAERKKAEEKQKQVAEEWKTTFDSITDMVSIHDKDFKIVRANKSFANALNMKPDEIIGKTCCELIHGTKEPPPFCPHKRTLDTGKPNRKEFFEPRIEIYIEASTSPLFDENGQIIASIHIAKDITERKQAEAELKAVQEKLIDTAHRAGMAEVAADVLHNVGNVLNSINVSATVIREKVTSSELANLEKVAGIINEHTDDLGTFLTEHPQGKNIPVYLTEVSKCLTDEQTDIIYKLKVLTENIQHIKEIVSMQQSYAKVSGVEVQTSISKLAEDAIQINSAGLGRHGARLIREFEELGDVEIDKQKVLQILVNLISNAKYALSGSKREEKLLTIRIYKHSEERFRIEVADNGVGISEDNLAKIFSYGFTTKKDGHGVGLHSSALAVKEMGGTLTVHSDGLGQGATFTLELPFKSVEVMK